MTIAAATLDRKPRFAAPPPLSLYVHIPWCLRKCPYCDFNSHEARGEIPEARYVESLLTDLELALPSIWGRRIQTIFVGGGTPSLFSAASIDRLLTGIRTLAPVVPDAEITLEANPGTFEREKFAGFRAAGVNRLSLGIQSFDARYLIALGRVHDEREARAAVAAALTLFDNVNLDLMYALPSQTIEDALADVEGAIAFAPQHLSFYQLTLEPNTRFHRHPPPLPDADATAAIEDAVHEALARAGYARYEVSAFARAALRCRHNLNYWRFGDYLGIGAGAHSKLSFADRIVRQMRFKGPEQYLDRVARRSPIAEEHEVAREEIGFEFMLNALRLDEGVASSLFAERTGHSLALVAREMAEGAARGLLDADPATIRPTPLGKRFLNDLTALFLTEAPKLKPALDLEDFTLVCGTVEYRADGDAG